MDERNNKTMAKKKEINEGMLPPEKSFLECVRKLKSSIKHRTGEDPEPWMEQAIEAAAMEEQAYRHYHRGVMLGDLTVIAVGSMGQTKEEANVMIPHRDKSSRTLNQWLTSLGLTYSATPSKVTESTKKGVDDEDPMKKLYEQAKL